MKSIMQTGAIVSIAFFVIVSCSNENKANGLLCQKNPSPECLLEQSSNAINSIADDYFRASALARTAKVQAKYGDKATSLQTFKLALAAANSIADDRVRGHALENIASVQTEAGLYSEAIKTANNITDGSDRNRTTVSIAMAQAKAGLYSEAVTTTTSINFNKASHAKTLADIAKLQAMGGDNAAALETIKLAFTVTNGINHDFYPVYNDSTNHYIKLAKIGLDDIEKVQVTLADAVKVQVQGGDKASVLKATKLAFTVASSIKGKPVWDNGPDVRAHALARIVSTQAEAGLYVESLITAKSITNKYDRAPAVANIANAQAKAGLYPEAIKTANSITYDLGRASVLADIAKLQEMDGEKAAALQTFKLAASTANSITDDDYEHATALARIVSAQTEAGLYTEAIATASSITDDSFRAPALASIATVMQASQ